MTRAPAALDLNRPDSVRDVGGELAANTELLVDRLALSNAVTDLVTLEQAVEDRRAIGDAARRVQEFFKPLKDTAYKLHRMLCDREGAVLAPLVLLDAVKRDAIAEFKKADDRARQERERAEAEQRRRDHEAQAAREAAALESAGEHALAEAVVAEAIAAPMPVVVLPDAKRAIDGLKFRREWKWRPANLALVPPEFKCLDDKKIGAYVRSMKESGRIPGIEIFFVDVPIR